MTGLVKRGSVTSVKSSAVKRHGNEGRGLVGGGFPFMLLLCFSLVVLCVLL